MIEGKQTRYDPLLIDILSAGIVLFVMLAGYLPFCDADTSKLYKKILIGDYKAPSWVSNDAKDLL
jgi:5'-AMP-activated protein kinase catalytic alpha subunit